MLKEHNVTLEKCQEFHERYSPCNQSIHYYLDLNRLGRSEARNSSAKRLVDLLLTAWEDLFVANFGEDESNVDRSTAMTTGLFYAAENGQALPVAIAFKIRVG